ncbi:hypothetical protein [Kribbella jiaozuonensis]|uniref:Uncharacterized protein n=1 Tax=Kribbella jiaozuonensis TaxID=2575441 RepID=A0A4V5UYE4_9ACTN|nr:hypothetical protein [Kribbella jiaozuonensis]TKK78403.1 hypothetical protein FDA38_25390 [Kribbella jiaozuonensis]
MAVTNDTKHQRAIGAVLDQFGQRGIYLAVRTVSGSYRLHTAGQKIRIRVFGRFSGDWQTDDWRRDVSDQTYDVVVLVDFTNPAPVLFIVPGQEWRDGLEARAVRDRDSKHQAITLDRVAQWLYRWDVLDSVAG